MSRYLPHLALAVALIAPAQAAKQQQAKPAKSAVDCTFRPKCTDLSTCEEAQHYLNDCGHQKLDRDRDGIPCETLCGDAKPKRK